MRFPRHKQIFRGQLDVAAFAGVLFIMLIFVLLRSQIVFTPGVPIRLPEADDMPGVVGETRVVAVDAGGQFYFDNQITPERILQQRLKEEVLASREPITLIIQADESVSAKKIKELLVLARRAGVRDAAWATRPPASVTDGATDARLP